MAGIAAGRALAARNIDFRIFESNPTIGGLCRSIERDGYTFDIGGCHVLHSRTPQTMTFVAAALDQNINRTERRASILHQQTHHSFPLASFLSELPMRERTMAVASLAWARLRLRREKNGTTDLAHWLRYTFGERLARQHYIPYAEKLWKLSATELDAQPLRLVVPPPRLRSFFRKSDCRRSHYVLHPASGGIQALAECLAATFRNRIYLATPVTALERRGNRYFVNGESFDGVISTLPLPTLVGACTQLRSLVGGATESLRFLSLATLSIATHAPPPFDYSWVYIPSQTDSLVHRISCMNNLGVANSIGTSLVAEITYPHHTTFPISKALIRRVVSSLAALRLVDPSTIQFTIPHTFSHAYVVIDLRGQELRTLHLQAAASLGIRLLGRFGEHRQANIDEILRNAETVVGDICKTH